MLAAAGIYLNTALYLPALVPTNALIHVYRSTQAFTKESAGSFHFHTLSCPSLPSSFTSFLPLISSLPYLPSIHPSLSSPLSSPPSLLPSLSPPLSPLPLPSLSPPSPLLRTPAGDRQASQGYRRSGEEEPESCAAGGTVVVLWLC